MNVLAVGERAPDFRAQTRAGVEVELLSLLKSAPVVLCFGMPQIHSSRLVVGYLRRLKEYTPELHIIVILQGEAERVESYAAGYLDALHVVFDKDLSLSRRYGVTHVPSTYYLVMRDGEAVVEASFTGFLRPAMNGLAADTAERTGAKVRELITPLDNKGEYELAERALS